jgi:hypothetical protein
MKSPTQSVYMIRIFIESRPDLNILYEAEKYENIAKYFKKLDPSQVVQLIDILPKITQFIKAESNDVFRSIKELIRNIPKQESQILYWTPLTKLIPK